MALTPARLRAIRENYQQRLESLLAVDEAIGQMMNQLAATGKLDNTYIIFTSDNGFMHGEHRIPQGKIVLYEPSVRVPLIIRGPGLPAGQHRSQFVANIDLAPTIVQAAGAQPGRVMDGRSLLPFAKDKLLQSGRDILLETPTYAGVRSPNWLYAEYTTGEKELYQLARDPYELNSQHINPAFDAMKTNLANRLARLRQCKGSVCRRGPQLGLSTRLQHRGGVRNCRSTSVLYRVGGPSSRRIATVVFYLDGHLLKRDRRRPFNVTVPKRFAKPAGSLVEAVITLTDSRRQTLGHRIVGCAF